MRALSLHSLHKRYPRSPGGLHGVSLDIPAGDHLAIVGPSGAGKTTLLRLIAGLETLDAGSIQFDGHDVARVPPHRRGIGWLGQRPALYPHFDVAGNLAAPVWLARPSWWQRFRGVPDPVSPAELTRRVADAAERLGLSALLKRRPHELSGGEQQRVAIGRLLVAQPGIWLLDEPLGHLDPPLRREIRREVGLLAATSGCTILEVTHDPMESRSVGRRVAVLHLGQLHQVGPAQEVYAFPSTRTAASLLGWPSMNFIGGTLGGTPDEPRLAADTQGGGFALPLPPPARSGIRVTLGVRPEALVAFAPSPAVDFGRWLVEAAEPVGPLWLLALTRDGHRWSMWHAEPVRTGATVPLTARGADLHWFDADTGRRI